MGLSVGERLDLQLTLHAGGAHMPDERLRRNEVASRLFAAPEADQITVGFLVAQDGDVRDLQQLGVPDGVRSEEHTSELQSRGHLVCRLLLEKKNMNRLCVCKHHW